MPEVTASRDLTRTSPRWPALIVLAGSVLALHLVLLEGGLTDFTARSEPTLEIASPLSRPPVGIDTHTSTDVVQPAMRTSTVRWIVPASTSEPASSPVIRPVHTTRAPAPVTAAQSVSSQEGLAIAPAPEPPPADLPASTEEPVVVPSPPEETALLAQAAPARSEPPASTTSKPLPPAQPPASARLQYAVNGQIKGFSYNATGTLDWEQSGGRYSARMEMRMPLLGSRVQTSTGRTGPEGLLPERFADKGRSEKAAHFEREQRRIRFSSNAPEAELMPGAQDRLSLFLQIASLLQARPQAYATGQLIDMQVAGTGDAEIWRFQVGQETTLALPTGELRVRHLVRQPRKEFDSTVEMWLAPELQHLPVRLRVTQANGDVADQQLSQKP